MTWFPCKRCAMYGASRPKSNPAISSTLMQALGMTRQEGYLRHCGRSLPSGFPTKGRGKFWSLLQGTPLRAGRAWQIVLTSRSLCHSTCPIRFYVLWYKSSIFFPLWAPTDILAGRTHLRTPIPPGNAISPVCLTSICRDRSVVNLFLNDLSLSPSFRISNEPLS